MNYLVKINYMLDRNNITPEFTKIGGDIGKIFGGSFGQLIGKLGGIAVSEYFKQTILKRYGDLDLKSILKHPLIEILTREKINMGSILDGFPNKLSDITFIGRTGGGKSSTINGLLNHEVFKVGAENGTTKSCQKIKYNDDYFLVDTPGLLDSDMQYSKIIAESIFSSYLVIYIVRSQLYEVELKIFESIYYYLLTRNTRYLRTSNLLLYINGQDIKELTMTVDEQEKEKKLITSQVSKWISKNNIVFGSSSPIRSKTISTDRSIKRVNK